MTKAAIGIYVIKNKDNIVGFTTNCLDIIKLTESVNLSTSYKSCLFIKKFLEEEFENGIVDMLNGITIELIKSGNTYLNNASNKVYISELYENAQT